MAESEGMIGYGTTVELETAANTDNYFELGEIGDITPAGDTAAKVDFTHMKSPGRRTESKSGLTEGGEAQFPLNWIPGNPTDQAIEAWRASGENRKIRITYPNGATETAPYSYSGFDRTAPVQGKLAGTLKANKAGDTVFG